MDGGDEGDVWLVGAGFKPAPTDKQQSEGGGRAGNNPLILSIPQIPVQTSINYAFPFFELSVVWSGMGSSKGSPASSAACLRANHSTQR